MELIPEDTIEMFRARKTIMEMLSDRGYVLPQTKVSETLLEFHQSNTNDGIVKIHILQASKELRQGEEDPDAPDSGIHAY